MSPSCAIPLHSPSEILAKYFASVESNAALSSVTYYMGLWYCLNHKLHANGLIHKPLTFFMSP